MSVKVDMHEDPETGARRLLIETDSEAGFSDAFRVAAAFFGESAAQPATVPERRIRHRPDKRKLTDEQARTLRRRYTAGESGTALAKEFGVGTDLIYSITSNRAYRNREAQP